MNGFNANFNKLLALVPTLTNINSVDVEIPGCATLYVKVESRFGPTTTLRLSQFSVHPSGQTIADPSLLVAISARDKTAEALVFQNYLGIRRVNSDDATATADESLKSSMNQYLGHWLAHLLAQRRAATAALLDHFG